MSDTTDNRPEGNDNSRYTDPQNTGAQTPGAQNAGIPPMPTRSPAAAAAAWPPPAPNTAAPQHGANTGAPQQGAYASAPSGATSPTGQAFGPGATAAHPTMPLHDGAPAAPRKKSAAPRVAALLVAAALVGGAAGLGGTYAGLNLWGGSSTTAAAGPSAITVNNPDDVNNTSAVAAKVVPSVVTISATGGSSGGTGSGVVLSSDGYVLTNTHVVTLDGQTGNATISVTTSDGKVYKATVVGTDPTYDLAVIKLEGASGLTPIEWADSSKLNVGDNTIAVGAPLDLPNTVTTGIVSALNRSIQVASSAAPSDGSDSQQDQGQGEGESPFRFDFGQGQQQQSASQTIKIAVIQTDAAINPGNSGGALVDSDGKLIGINVAIASAGGSSSGGQSGNIGVGFSIPSDIAKRISTEIIDNGSATHGLLGASVQDAASIQGATTTGAYVAEAQSGGAAASAGLTKGDVITKFNGVPITNSIDLTAQVRALAAGSKAEVTYNRNGQEKTVEVTLGSMPTS
ncbi:trypsin-like peptidase domain-containing protein [Microbacterium sp. KSW2-21]|uniref:Trypsin-like peptidase domain-containing protein n=1 Tax=Microbacterium algihabitans TaxID=3075992 RepID=A0ABU3RVD1_9MICO|nr:trypsin-like peptidase domain-containing protein [Microbacterium sp. KSW2-21]MDU0326850.1 trypsin-like peptidase domain-containing protein [Microbacterium sp. KSW2-21]